MPTLQSRPRVSVASADDVQHRRQLAEAVNRLIAGQSDNTLTLTLTPSATATSIMDPRISALTCVALMPHTADAAAALPTTSIVCTNGLAVVTHASAATADRIFTAALIG